MCAASVPLLEGVDPEVVVQLRGMGHEVVVATDTARSVFGRGQIIRRISNSGVLWAGSDGRADGCAIGW